MKRFVFALLIVLLLVGVASPMLAVRPATSAEGSIVTQRAFAFTDPKPGTIVRIRGVLVYGSLLGTPYQLQDGNLTMPLVPGPENPVMAAVRRIPIIGQLIPDPPQLHPIHDRIAVYRIKIGVCLGGSRTCNRRSTPELLDGGSLPG